MMKLCTFWPVASMVVFFGCSAATDLGAERVHRSTEALAIAIPPDADLSVPPNGSVTFAVVPGGDGASEVWEERVDAPLFAGAKVTVTARRERFPRCGIGGEVTAYFRTDGGAILAIPLDQGDPGYLRAGVFEIPGGVRHADMWLRATTSDGCEEWDSDYGRNYAVEVYDWQPTVLTFDAAWNETETVLPSGGAAVIDYDFARLPNCRGTYRGFPSWDILLHARFDDGTMVRQSMVRLGYDDRGVPDGTVKANRVVLPIVRTAKHVSLWFENTQYPPTCQAWDSDYERNYNYAAGVVPGKEGMVSCAGGGLVVSADASQDPGVERTYTGVVTDQAAIDYFVARSQEIHTQTVDVYGGGQQQISVPNQLPYNMIIEGTGAGRRMLVTDLRPSLAGGFAAGQFAANLDATTEGGLTLSVTNLYMVNSHTPAMWELGRWTFAPCASK